MTKSARTKRQYQKTFKGQGKLTGYGFKAPQYDSKVKVKQPSLPMITKTTQQQKTVQWRKTIEVHSHQSLSYGAQK